jgi:hypothetical protein
MTITPPNPGLTLVASTGVAGFAKQNGTPNILTWTAPNDGNPHSVIIFASETVTTLEAGGGIGDSFTAPGGGFQTATAAVFAGAKAAGTYHAEDMMVVGPGTTLTVFQGSALTSGACTVWLTIWAN